MMSKTDSDGSKRTGESSDWPGKKGFRREVDLSKGPEDFEDGDRVPVPRYFGTVTWVFPPRWAPDEDGDR